jgi:hypothetical protein
MDALATLTDHLSTSLDAHVGHQTPDITTGPWVRVHVITEHPKSRSSALHAVTVHWQIDVYDDTLEGAQDLATVAAHSLHADLPGDHDTVIVTGCRITGRRPLYDQDFVPDKPRVIVEGHATMHPARGMS